MKISTSYILAAILGLMLSANAMTVSALTITTNNSGIEWSGALSVVDEYDDGVYGSDTALDVIFQPGSSGGSVGLNGASASSSGDVELLVLDQGVDFAIYSNLSALADLSLAVTGGAKPIDPAEAYAVAEAFINLDFTLGGGHQLVAASDLFDAQASSDAFFSVILTDVTNNTTVFDVEVNDDTQVLDFAALLGPGDYNLAISAYADITGFTGTASVSGDFLINLTPAVIPLPAAAWLFLSGAALLTAVSARRRR